MGYVHCKMYYVVYIVTAFTNFLLDATAGLQHDVLLQILLSFTLIFHLRSIIIGGNRGVLNFEKLCCFSTFRCSLLCEYIHNQQKLCLYRRNIKTESKFSN